MGGVGLLPAICPLYQAFLLLNRCGVRTHEQETIKLPEFDSRAASRQMDADSIELPSAVLTQLRDYVGAIADMYRDCPFHNFAHASHGKQKDGSGGS